MNEKEKTREDPLLALIYVKGGRDVHGIFRETQWMSVYQNLDSPCLWGNQPHDIIEIKVPLWENMEVYLIFTKNLSQSILSDRYYLLICEYRKRPEPPKVQYP